MKGKHKQEVPDGVGESRRSSFVSQFKVTRGITGATQGHHRGITGACTWTHTHMVEGGL